MNEQIKRLATEARLLTGWSVGEVEYQKFAELIVKECAGLAEDGFDDELDGQEICDSIKQHFGVE
jgi:hypothetical protein